ELVQGRETQYCARKPARRARCRDPVTALLADRSREERLRLRVLDGEAHRSAAEVEYEGRDRAGRGRRREVEERARIADTVLARYPGRPQLCPLRAAGS